MRIYAKNNDNRCHKQGDALSSVVLRNVLRSILFIDFGCLSKGYNMDLNKVYEDHNMGPAETKRLFVKKYNTQKTRKRDKKNKDRIDNAYYMNIFMRGLGGFFIVPAAYITFTMSPVNDQSSCTSLGDSMRVACTRDSSRATTDEWFLIQEHSDELFQISVKYHLNLQLLPQQAQYYCILQKCY
ncbi:hypothetical protein ACJX0J_015214 [Zea mays]